jgi:hypothetical protein
MMTAAWVRKPLRDAIRSRIQVVVARTTSQGLVVRWRFHFRMTSFRSSVNQRTMLPIATHTSHWSQLKGTVLKARLRNPICTTATCNMTERASAPHSQGLTKDDEKRSRFQSAR